MRNLKKLIATVISAALMLGTFVCADAQVVNYNALNQYNDDQPYYLVDLDAAAVEQGFDLTSIYGFNVYITWADVTQIDFVEAQLSYNGTSSGWVRVGGNVAFKTGVQVDGSTYCIDYMNDAPLYTAEDAEFAEIQIESYYADFTVEKAEVVDADGNVIATIQCNGATETGSAQLIIIPMMIALVSGTVVLVSKKIRR